MSIYKTVTGKGEEVVLIHGWSCDHRYMQPISNLLASHYRVTNIDVPGCGKSNWQTKFKSIHDIADALLPHLPDQAVYIGWSFGGLLALSIAARYPERVKRIVGIATSPKFIEDKNWLGLPQPGFKESFLPEIQKLGLYQVFKNIYDAEFSSFDPKPREYHQLGPVDISL